MALGAESVPRPRTFGILVLIEWISSLWPGSFMSGIGPPPWQTEMTGARAIVGPELVVMLEVKSGCWNNFAADRKEDVRLRTCIGRISLHYAGGSGEIYRILRKIVIAYMVTNCVFPKGTDLVPVFTSGVLSQRSVLGSRIGSYSARFSNHQNISR